MGRTTPLIRAVATPAYGRVVIEASDGNRYSADLSAFRAVSCYPPDAEAWTRVSIDSYGLALVWACRFEVHADQVVGLADKIERADAAA
jgi:hypothetical protein